MQFFKPVCIVAMRPTKVSGLPELKTQFGSVHIPLRSDCGGQARPSKYGSHVVICAGQNMPELNQSGRHCMPKSEALQNLTIDLFLSPTPGVPAPLEKPVSEHKTRKLNVQSSMFPNGFKKWYAILYRRQHVPVLVPSAHKMHEVQRSVVECGISTVTFVNNTDLEVAEWTRKERVSEVLVESTTYGPIGSPSGALHSGGSSRLPSHDHKSKFSRCEVGEWKSMFPSASNRKTASANARFEPSWINSIVAFALFVRICSTDSIPCRQAVQSATRI